jgi:hypothetical protein
MYKMGDYLPNNCQINCLISAKPNDARSFFVMSEISAVGLAHFHNAY